MKRIGVIEVDNDRARVTVLERFSEGLREINRQEGQIEEISALEGLKDYVLFLPDDAVNLRYLELPFQEEERLRQVLPYELKELTTYEPEEIVFSVIPLATDGKVLVGFTERDFLEGLLKRFQDRGLHIQRVTSLELFLTLKETEGTPLEGMDRIEAMKEELLDGRIDFLKGTIGYERRLALMRDLLNGILRLVGVVLLGIGIILSLRWYPLRAEDRELSSLKEKLFKKVKPEATVVAPLYQLKAEIKHLKEQMKELAFINVLEDMASLGTNWPESMRAEQIEIRPEGIIIKGYARDLKEVERLKDALKTNASLVNVLESEKAGEMMRYTIEVKR